MKYHPHMIQYYECVIPDWFRDLILILLEYISSEIPARRQE